MPALPQNLRDALAALGGYFAAIEDASDDPPPADPPPADPPPKDDPPPADPPADPPPDEPPTPAHWMEKRWGGGDK